ncbi:MAG: molybdopterin-dependent oxidoreductase [Acidimicrobiales bacterium]|nr:molybdopterin-dependent oxidoreductase [Acidimicrobiales bacterium]
MSLRPSNILKWKPRNWAGLTTNGVGKQQPKHFKAMAKVVLANKRHPIYAWRVLSRGVCDGCALGVAGFRDWTIEGVHLCTTRLDLLSLNTGDAVDPSALRDAEALAAKSGAELRAMGRLGYPMRRRAGERGFTRISWEAAMDAVTDALRSAGGHRSALFLTSRGITNEVYYATGKAARALGIANVDSAARVCHAPSTTVLKETIGAAPTTCSFADVIESDLVVLIGSNPANNQPVFMKYLYEAKRDSGTKVVVINPYLEPGLERYWVPSSAESMIFGTKICDLHVPVRPGGDVALLNAALKQLIARDAVDHAFIDAHTTGWDALVAELDGQDDAELLRLAGITQQQLDAFVDLYAGAEAAVLVWSMGITQRVEAADGVEAIVNFGLARGNVGRDGAGLMPIRGHSGVQGGGEMGAYATLLPGARSVTPENCSALEAAWGFPVPHHVGLTAPEMLDAAERDELDVLYVSGGNFLDVLPDPPRVAKAMAKVPLRVHQDVVITSQMLVTPADGCEVILLPTTTRYEQEGGGTETTTERRIVFSPHIPGHTVGEARSEWRIVADVAARVRPDLAPHFAWPDNKSLREEIARVVPLYAGIETLAATGDAVQWGGRHLAPEGNFPTADGRARFRVVTPRAHDLAPGQFAASTRRGKQFNSMVQAAVDPLNGAHRDDILIDPADAAALGLNEGAAVVVRSETGELRGRLKFAKLPSQSIQVHWPEGNVLIPAGPEHRDPHSRVPDYNAVVTITPA